MLGLLILSTLAELSQSIYSPSDNQVKCFCDKANCPGELICTGKWCLIGVRSEGSDDHGKLDQICGYDDAERPVDCAQGWNKWSEVCACQTPLCNTFSHLRENMDRLHFESRKSDRRGIYTSSDDDLSGAKHDSNDQQQQPNEDGAYRGWHKSGNIVFLLIVVPLAVGDFAMFFIFLNYHCRMN